MFRSALVLLLLLPLGLTAVYSPGGNLLRLLEAAVGQTLGLLLIFALLSRIPRQRVRQSAGLALVLVCGLFQSLRLVSFFFQGESFNQRFFFHFNLQSVTEAGSAYLTLQAGVTVYLLTLAALAWFAFAAVPVRTWMPSRFAPASVVTAVVLLLVIEPDLSALMKWQYQSLVEEDLVLARIDWDELDLNPQALTQNVEAFSAGKNLVFIYLESLEQTYFDQTRFPDLLPNLSRLQQEALNFTALRQVPGTGWTVGGIVSSQCGVPLLTSLGTLGNDLLQNGFLNEAVCLADMLAAAGYRQNYVGGASTEFAGKGSFLREHGYDLVEGREELLPLIPDQSYVSGWGLYDDDLLKLAADRYRELAAGDRPFNLTLLTLDTHHPDGDPSRSCVPYQAIDNTILHAVHCTDQLVSRFIETLKQDPAWSDTLVVLLSDHLAMRNVAQRYYPPVAQRLLYLSILNGGITGNIEIPGTHFDIGPTIMSLLGIEPEPQFLAGQNLLVPAPVDKVDADLKARLDALALINTSVLTETHSVCYSERLVTVRDNQLFVGDQPVVLSRNGNLTDLSLLNDSHALLVLLRPDGSISFTFTEEHSLLASTLFRLRDETMLVVGRNTGIIDRLTGPSVTGNDLVVLLGGAEVSLLGRFASLQKLQVRVADCDGLLARAAAPDLPSAWPGVADLCLDFDPQIGNSINPNTGTIRLADVVMENQLFRAELVPVGDGLFQGRNVQPAGPIDSRSVSECHARVEDTTLFIPQLQNGDRLQSMVLEAVADKELLFSVSKTLEF